jgi:hypothetical protein
MRRAALGFRVHSGWTALVALTLEDGLPRVLLRGRPQLVKTFTYEFRQPYHTAEKKPRAEAAGVISRARDEARQLAHRAIHAAQTTLEQQDYQLVCCGLLLASGKRLPELERILESHALIHTADGELFREAIIRAGEECGVALFSLKEHDLLEKAKPALRLQADEIGRRLTDLGRPLGAPWSQDEKFAALVAWLSLLRQERAL